MSRQTPARIYQAAKDKARIRKPGGIAPMRARRRDRTTSATGSWIDVPSIGSRRRRQVELIDSDSAVTFPIVDAATTPRLSSIIFLDMLRTPKKILFILSTAEMFTLLGAA